MTTDVLIIGGGAIGLSIAFHLARLEPTLTITLADLAVIGGGEIGQASYAAAGMLAPFAEAHSAGPLVPLGVESLSRYPAFVEAVRAVAGNDGDPLFQITGPGMLRVALNDGDADRLRDLYMWQRNTFAEIEALSGDTARRLEPALSPEVQFALLSPIERQVDPRRMTRSLAAANARLGVTLLSNQSILSIDRSGDGYSVTLGDDEISCGVLVLAGGAWCKSLGALTGIEIPVSPVRGQILALAPAAGDRTPLRHTIYASNAYLVPRPEGRVVVGATEEPGAGFEAVTFESDIRKLRNAAAELAPSLCLTKLDGPAWAGLRPASLDGLPILGPLSSQTNLHVATGHFRNGILLTPITGEIIAYGIVNGVVHPSLAPEFSPDRFNQT